MYVSDNATKFQNGIQNLTIDYSTDTKGRILSAAYNEIGGFNGNLTYVYDNYGNVAAQEDDDGNPAKAILINPNNGAIDTRYNPYDIDDPFTYRVRDGFMSIGNLWANDDGTVYLQGHPVIPNPWGNVSTNGTTTTTTDDTTDKDGGDDAEPCGETDEKGFWEKVVDCLKGKGLEPKLPEGWLEWITAIGSCGLCCLCIMTSSAVPGLAVLACAEPCGMCAKSFNLDPIAYIVEFVDCIIQVISGNYSKKGGNSYV